MVHLDTDLEFYKKLSLLFTVAFLLPVIVVMVRKIDAHNFSKFLALTNLIAFNFGFHVHEKAMLLCLIPLGLVIYQQRDHESIHQADGKTLKNQNLDLSRFKLLKTVFLWTLLPLIFTSGETVVKHGLMFVDVFLTDLLLQENHFKTVKATWREKVYGWLHTLTKIGILVVQVA